MNNKLLIGFGLLTLVLLFGGIFVLTKSSSPKASLTKVEGAKIQVLEENFNFGEIGYSKGVVSHSFKVKNSGEKNLEVANLATSCMCTKVYMKTSQGEGPKSSMKGMSKPSSWIGIVEPGKEAEIIALFDPAFHGPQGAGLLSRTISFETNDPDKTYVELAFSGVVVK